MDKNIPDESFMEQIRALHILFENGFSDAYRDANTRKRRRIMPHVAALYRRWYYATLLENTPFTPANIVESIALHYKQDPNVYPLAVLRNTNKFMGFDIKMQTNDADNHPVIADIKILMDYCFPHVDLQVGDCFFDRQITILAEELSLPDPTYVSFLLEIVRKMKWLGKVPSLYVNRFEPVRNWQEKLNKENLFIEIVEAAVLVCAHNLRELISLPEVIFTDSFVRSMLTVPVETDALFEQVYDILGYTLEDLIKLSMESDILDFDTQDGAFLAGTFLMGVILDQHFYTPFGQFLKLIKPLYVIPFDFANEIDEFIANVTNEDGDIFTAFFAPCSGYTLTALGLQIFNIKPNEKNYYDVEKFMPFSVLKESLFAEPHNIEIVVKMAQLFPAFISGSLLERPVYTFRIRMRDEPGMWIHLHMPDNAFLYQIYEEVVLYFPLRENHDYSFFHDTTENLFAEYPSLKRVTPRNKKTAHTPLGELDFGHQNKMILTAYNQALPFGGLPPSVRLEIEMMGQKQPEPDQDYPRIARISKAVKMYLNEVE